MQKYPKQCVDYLPHLIGFAILVCAGPAQAQHTSYQQHHIYSGHVDRTDNVIPPETGPHVTRVRVPVNDPKIYVIRKPGPAEMRVPEMCQLARSKISPIKDVVPLGQNPTIDRVLLHMLNVAARRAYREDHLWRHDPEIHRELERISATKRFVGGVAHDLNNILSAILGYTELMRHPDSKNSRVNTYCERVWRAGNRINEVVKDTLGVSRSKFDEKAQNERSFLPALDFEMIHPDTLAGKAILQLMGDYRSATATPAIGVTDRKQGTNPTRRRKAILRNVRRRRRAMESLSIHTEREISRQLSAIEATTDLLHPDDINSDGMRSVEQIATATKRARSLMKTLRTFSEHPYLPRDIRLWKLRDVIEGAVLGIKPTNKKLSVVVEGESKDTVAFLDPDRIVAAVANAVLNGFQANPATGVFVTIGTNQNEISISVRDDGDGIAPDNLTMLRKKASFTTKGNDGHGFGVRDMREVVEKQHGGRLKIHSDVGDGSKFEFILPLNLASVLAPTH